MGNKTYDTSLAVALITEKKINVMYKDPSNASRQQMKIRMSSNFRLNFSKKKKDFLI